MPAELVFFLSAAAIVIAGARLARDGETIADRTGLGQGWVGAILVAIATSLPEIVTDIAAVRQGDSDLAIGDLFGSSMTNMLILAVADLMTRGGHLMLHVHVNQAMVGVLAIAVTAIAAAGVLAGEIAVLFGVGWAPLTIALAYVLGIRLIHRQGTSEQPRRDQDTRESTAGDASLRAATIGFAVAAGAILVAGPFLARSAATLAEQWGIASGFFGMVFLAAATSLPEVAVVVSAVKAGAYTLAVGNLFGSNCANMALFIILDVLDGGGSLLAGAEPGVVVGAVFAVVLTALALLDLLNRSERRIWFVEPGPAAMVMAYAAGVFLTYRATH